ncbi:MAG: bifunctional metallophosphatase/5'-nucleotidase [Candidatus Riflebacteria bacterium]|nr:bifunctional metallophosphatase/5'-nucleotidase [Candidatus Riflebacteria bacterium]
MLRTLTWIAILLICTLAALVINDQASVPSKYLHVLYTSNLRGQIKPFSGELGDYNWINAGGFAYIKGFADNYLKENNITHDSLLILDTGDSLFGSAESSLTMGKAVFDLMEKIPYNAISVGNLEFELGIETLRSFAERKTIPFLACNYRDLKSLLENTFTQGKIFEKCGTKIGVIGLGHAEISKHTKRENLLELEITDMKASVAKAALNLKSQGAELIILLSHHPKLTDQEQVRTLFPDVDIVIGDLIINTTRKNDSENIIIEKPYICPSPFSRGAGIGVLKVPFLSGSAKPEMSKSYTRIIDTEIVKPSQMFTEEVSKIESKVDTLLEEIIANAEGDFKRAFNEESSVGNLIADAYRDAAQSSVAFQNSGGIKASISSGPISLRDLYDLLPFENNIVKIDMRGWEIENLLEDSLTDSNSFLQSSGIDCTWSSQNPEGFRIIQLVINQEPIEWNNVYSVAMTDYMLENLVTASNSQNRSSPIVVGTVREALKKYLKSKETISPSTERRFEDIGNQDQILTEQALGIELASLSVPLNLTGTIESPMACYIAEMVRQETDSDFAFIDQKIFNQRNSPVESISASLALEIFNQAPGIEIAEIPGNVIKNFLEASIEEKKPVLSFAGFSIEIHEKNRVKIFPWEGDFEAEKIYKVAFPTGFISLFDSLKEIKTKKVYQDIRRVFLTGVRRKNGKVESRRAIY